MAKQNKTFKLDDGTITIIQQLTDFMQISQAEVIRMAVEKAYGDHQPEQKALMAVYDEAAKGIEYLEAVRDQDEDSDLDENQRELYQFLNMVFDEARKLPQFPDWA